VPGEIGTPEEHQAASEKPAAGGAQGKQVDAGCRQQANGRSIHEKPPVPDRFWHYSNHAAVLRKQHIKRAAGLLAWLI
jgi:hypothetical protein